MASVPTEKELLKDLNEHTSHADELANVSDKEWSLESEHGKEQDTTEGPLHRLRGSVKKYDDPLESLPDWDEWSDGETD